MSSPAPDDSVDRQIAREAETWLGRHDRGLTPPESAAFAQWSARSARHAAEFDRLSTAWHASDLLKADATLTARAAQLSAKTATAARSRAVRRARLAWAGGLCAAAAAVAVVFRQPWQAAKSTDPVAITARSASVQVRSATARNLTLPDGSVVRLRGDSEITSNFTAAERRIRLVRGEAFFAVQKDAARPFIVESSGIGVRAVGTAFNVKVSSASLDVLVTEGVIALQDQPGTAPAPLPSNAPRAQAGEQARVDLAAETPIAAATVTAIPSADIDRALDWQVARLTFERATLAEALAAFNDHGATRFELADPALAPRLVSGAFRADRGESFVRLLEQASEVRVERHPDGRVRLHAAP